jgi:hypothetical protein
MLWIALAALALGVAAMFFALRRRPQPRDAKAPPPLSKQRLALTPVVPLAASGDYDFAIDGEAENQTALDEICGGRTAEGHEQEADCLLAPYSDGSVRVEIEDRVVGWLSPAHAGEYAEAMGRQNLARRATSCRALITGGKPEAPYDIKLDLMWPPKPNPYATSLIIGR